MSDSPGGKSSEVSQWTLVVVAGSCPVRLGVMSSNPASWFPGGIFGWESVSNSDGDATCDRRCCMRRFCSVACEKRSARRAMSSSVGSDRPRSSRTTRCSCNGRQSSAMVVRTGLKRLTAGGVSVSKGSSTLGKACLFDSTLASSSLLAYEMEDFQPVDIWRKLSSSRRSFFSCDCNLLQRLYYQILFKRAYDAENSYCSISTSRACFINFRIA
jgi:hypothetical protein